MFNIKQLYLFIYLSPHSGRLSPAAPERIGDASTDLRPLLRPDDHQQRDRRHHSPARGSRGPGVHHCSVGPRLLGLLTQPERPAARRMRQTRRLQHQFVSIDKLFVGNEEK